MNQPSPSRPHLLPPPVSGLPVAMGPKSVDFEFLECLGSGTYGKVYVEERERVVHTLCEGEKKRDEKRPGLRCVCVCV